MKLQSIFSFVLLLLLACNHKPAHLGVGGGGIDVSQPPAALSPYSDAVQPPLGATTIQGAIDKLKPAAAPTRVVFQPGGTNGPGVFTDFSLLNAAYTSYVEPLDLYCDAQFAGGNCNLPAGTWNFSSTLLSMTGPAIVPGTSTITLVFFPTNCKIPALRVIDNVVLINNGTTVPIQVSSGHIGAAFTVKTSAGLATFSAQPVVQYDTASGDFMYLYMYDSGTVYGNGFGGGNTSVFKMTGPGHMYVYLFGTNEGVYANSFGAPTAAQVSVYQGPGFYQFDLPQVAILDTGALPTPSILNKANYIAYTDTAAPILKQANVSAAIDAFKTRWSVRACATGNVSTTSAPTTIDGVTLASGDKVFLPAQTTATQKGIWTFNGAAAAMTRPVEWATGAVIPSGAVVQCGGAGTLYANSEWKQTSAANTVDTSSPLYYPRSVTQQVTLSAGASTITNVPILSATASQFLVSRITATGVALTVSYVPVSITAGVLGTATVTVNADIAAGTINTADTSVLNVTVQNF